MDSSPRSVLTAALSTVAISALTLTPTMLPPAPPPTVQVAPTAASGGLAGDASRPTRDMLQAAAAAAEALVAAAGGSSRVTLTQIPAGGQSANVAPSSTQTLRPQAGAAPTAATPLNAASNIIDAVYSVSKYWANYVSLELGPWLINWIPFGYLVSDQITMWYSSFVLPVVDSFVYDFLDPVVNNPLSLSTWLNGFGAMAGTAIDGVIDGIRAEVNYVLTGGWLPFPLPPLPTVAPVAPDAVDMISPPEADKPAAAPDEQQPVTGPAKIRHTVERVPAPPADTDDTTAEPAGQSAIGTAVADSDSDAGPPDTPGKPGRKAPKRNLGAPAAAAPAVSTAAPAKTARSTDHHKADRDRSARSHRGKIRSAD